MTYLLQSGIILGASCAGELLKRLIPLPVPASVWGLCLLLALLGAGIVKADFIRPTAQFFIQIMPLLFVPSVVRLLEYRGVIASNLLPFVLAIILVTIIVMAVTGVIVSRMGGGGTDE